MLVFAAATPMTTTTTTTTTLILPSATTDREKPRDSSMLLLAAEVKLRVDVILPLPLLFVVAFALVSESRCGELVEPDSLSVGAMCGT